MYKTILMEIKTEIIIKKSRFIAHISPVKTEEEAKHYIDNIKRQHNQATHNVPVFVIGEKHEIQRYSDDGEPSGTAGMPVLDMYKKQNITNLCSVVTRYFGGIKLGTGGLVRAYTEVVKAALKSQLVTVKPYIYIVVTFDYSYYSKIEYTLNAYGAHISRTDFTDSVKLCSYAIPAQAENIKAKLIDITSNNISIVEEQVYGTIKEGVFLRI